MRYLKEHDGKDTIASGLETNEPEVSQEDFDRMDLELPDGIDDELLLQRSDSLLYRRFDPMAVVTLDLSRNNSSISSALREVGQNMSGAEFDYFMQGQQTWVEDSGRSASRPRGRSALDKQPESMMEEKPLVLGRQNSRGFSTMDFLSKQLEADDEDFLSNPNQETDDSPTRFTYEDGPRKKIDYDSLPFRGDPVLHTAADEIFSHNGGTGGKIPFGVGEPVMCTCSKSQCLKLYCHCFRSGLVCGRHCRCENCLNSAKNQEQVAAMRLQNIARKSQASEVFCNCRMSFCEKNYCACARSGLGCSKLCKCFNCKNSKGLKPGR